MRDSNGGRGKVNGARIKYSCVHGRKEGRPSKEERRKGDRCVDGRNGEERGAVVGAGR